MRALRGRSESVVVICFRLRQAALSFIAGGRLLPVVPVASSRREAGHWPGPSATRPD